LCATSILSHTGRRDQHDATAFPCLYLVLASSLSSACTLACLTLSTSGFHELGISDEGSGAKVRADGCDGRLHCSEALLADLRNGSGGGGALRLVDSGGRCAELDGNLLLTLCLSHLLGDTNRPGLCDARELVVVYIGKVPWVLGQANACKVIKYVMQ
jgi:hypothetical protein